MIDWTTLGLQIIRSVQTIRTPELDFVMKLITLLGTEGFYLVALPILFWCWNREIGVRIGVLFLLSALLNFDLKHFFHLPRPFIKDPNVQVMAAYDFSFPSGHAQLAMVFWGFIAYLKAKPRYYIAALLIILVVGFSRIYLGVHYPTDVIAGWAIGFLSLLVFIAVEKKIAAWLMQRSLLVHYSVVIAIPLILAALYPHIRAWIIAFTMIGLGMGYILNRKYLQNHQHRRFKLNLLRYVLGILVVITLFLGLRYVLPGESSGFYPLYRCLRYFLTGFIVSFVIPLLFERLKL